MPSPLTRRQALTAGALGIGAVAAAPVLAACGGNPAASGAVNFEGWDYQSTIVAANVKRFTKLNSSIKVNYTPITSAQYVQKLVAQYTGGSQPDALYVYDDSLAGWVDAGYLQPIDGMDGVDKVYSGLYPSNAAAMTYKGKKYGLPYYTDCQALIYNADILRKAGISAPPKSLPELEQQCLKIRKAGIIQHPFGLSAQLSDTWWAWVWGLYYASGAKVFDDNLQPVMATSDPVVRNVLDWIRGAAQQSKVLDTAALQLAAVPFDNAFMSGQYAFTIGARYAARQYNDKTQSKVAGNVKIAMLPSVDGKTQGTVSNTRMYGLSAKTKHKDDAFKLISYLGGLDNSGDPYTAKLWLQKEGLGFAFKSMAADPKSQQTLREFVDPTIYNELASVAKPRNVIAAPWYTEYETSQQKVIQQLITGQTSGSAGAKSLAATAARLKKKYS